ncbi:MAG: FGGY-family carbohydrate kinase [Sphaerochaetaceae bacterium]|jgi:xylulokinase|nr:FGGY-family carbohydrate kinase [Sphaerochaetaceae bacterium]MDD3366870.1 FGGY-family carbohydrate kinase [Sphaerochaetaceae bacterium]MDD4219041.1 FGGY-family carbohydrate kinase [Sphaerochaetaceae bacterium]MDY0371327.1 FGGY-family carbohydrate kinase [Sphaerochaetaceae bacterium]
MVLSIDVGTTTCKAALFDADGVLQKLVKIPLSIICETPGAQEADPRQWANALATICQEISTQNKIRAIVVSGNGPTVVPVFAEPALEQGLLYAESAMARLWLDQRAVAEASEISGLVGNFVDASFVLPKVLHLCRNEKELYQRSKFFLSSFEYINYLLTGEARTILHADDALRWYWTNEMLDAVGLDRAKFPPFCRPGDVIGTVSALASQALGITQGILVYAGGPDFLVSILGCAVVEPGMVCNRSGTSEGINLCTNKPLDDTRLLTYLHPVAPFFNVSGIISTSGKAIGWAKELLGLQEISFATMYAIMEQAPPGSGGMLFLPYLSGERAPIWDPDAKGIFSGLTLATGRAEILRAVAEGVCFAIRDVIEVMEELGGSVNAIRATGGPTESKFLNQLKADVTGRSIVVPLIGDAELVGSMVLARTALGDYATRAEAASELVQMGQTYQPNVALAPLYDELFDQYRATYRALKGTWRTK